MVGPVRAPDRLVLPGPTRGRGGDELEVLLLELGERLAVEPEGAEHVLLVEKRDHDRARDPVQDHRFALRRREVHRRVVGEHRGAFGHDVVMPNITH